VGFSTTATPNTGSAAFLTCLGAFLTCFMWPIPAHAQAQSAPLSQQRPWDATFVVGFLGGHPDMPDATGYHDDWFETGQAGVVLGLHLSTNVKAELEFSASGEGRQFIERYTTVPGYPFPAPYGSDLLTSVREVRALLTWQFWDNQWVHPFVQIGGGADFDRVRIRTWEQFFFGGDPRQPGYRMLTASARNEGPETTAIGRVVIGGGAKMYVTPRAFVRADGRLASGKNGQRVALRIGLGVDF